MEIEVDYDLCEANAVCMDVLPEVFHVDENDDLYVTQPDLSKVSAEQVRRAVESCPMAALTLKE